MQPIRQPQLLDPDRVLDNDRNDLTADHKARAELLNAALQETTQYARQLWATLNYQRTYLMDSLPPDSRSLTPGARAGTSPTGPDDEPGWQAWIENYAAVTSILCGPHGDSGFGLSEGRQAATDRRDSPVLRLHADHPAGPATRRPSKDETSTAPNATARPKAARVAGITVLTLLAIRGVLPRRAQRSIPQSEFPLR